MVVCLETDSGEWGKRRIVDGLKIRVELWDVAADDEIDARGDLLHTVLVLGQPGQGQRLLHLDVLADRPLFIQALPEIVR